MGHEVSFGHHRFDPQTGRLWAGRREVGLTPRAAAVLAVLVARAGHLVTRRELFDSVWGDTVVGDAALTACIQELRGALGDDARRPRFIETRHRRGYRFTARVLPAPSHPSRGAPAPPPPGPPALVVGRDRELSELRACLERAASGHRQIVFVTGEPGIGKTTLVELFLAEAARGEWVRVAQGRCIETHGAGEAYLPLLEALTRLCREPGGQAITRLLRQHAPTWLAQMPSVLSASEKRTFERQASGVTRERMLRELAEAVETLAAEQEVALQVALGGPLMAVKGRGAPEVEQAYTRAQELCQQIGDTPQLFPVVWGLWLFRRSRGQIDQAHAFATRLLALAGSTGDPDLLIEAHHALWATLFARGELVAVGDHAARALALYDPERPGPLAAVYGNHDPAVCALGHGAWALELRGEPGEASRQSADAVALARRLGHPFSEAHALLYAARLHQFRGDWEATRDRAEAAAVLARERGFVQLQTWADVTGGWAQAEGGAIAEGLARVRDGIGAIRALGSEDFRTYFLGLLTATLVRAGEPVAALDVVTEALAAVERSGERFYAAELHRQHGALLLATGHDPSLAARCFEAAVEIARQQHAQALECRALRDLDEALSRAGGAASSVPSPGQGSRQPRRLGPEERLDLLPLVLGRGPRRRTLGDRPASR